MKNALKSLSLLMVLGGLIFISSCSDDDGGIDIGGGDGGAFTVADGLYIAGVSGSDTTVVTANKLNATLVEDEGFGTKERSGFFGAYVFLEAGSYIFLDVADQQASDVFGGATSTYNDDEADNTDDYSGGYTVVDLSGEASTFDVSEEGLYNVTFDTQTSEALLIKIDSWGVIGGAVFSDACSSDGFNADVDLDDAVSISADGSSFTGQSIILKDAEFKFRYNDSWKVDRRTDKSSFDDANGYVLLTNIGGTPDALVEGGANIGMSDNNIENGLYDVFITIDDVGVIEMDLGRTAAAPECAFDPDNFTWGIIGSGTQGTEATAGWSDDKNLIYAGQNGSTHTWRGVFPIAGGTADNEFKFRTDDTWATKLIPNSVEYTDNSGNITDNADSNGDGSWFVAEGASGFYYIVVTTEDNGDSWNLTIDDAEFQVIGEGSPVGNWDAGNGIAMTYNDDLASATLASGAYTDAGWKIFVNQSFDYNVGGALDGTTALEFNNSTFNLDAAGDYSVTISTADGGVTYTATATAN